MDRKLAKSIWAVIAGFLTVFILSSGMDFMLETIGVFPPISSTMTYSTGMLLVALLYRCSFTVMGGYVTAYLAPKDKMKHVIVLAVLGTIGGIVGVFAGWNLSAHWYPIALAVSAFPLVYLGGKLRIKK